MGEATPAEWRWRLLGYLQLLQGDPIDRLTVRPTLLDLRTEKWVRNFGRKIW